MTIALLLTARTVHFGSGMILAGMVAFRWLVLLPGFSEEGEAAWRTLVPLFRRLQILFLGATAAFVGSGFLMFWAVAANMSGTSLTESFSADTLGTVLFQTQFGRVTQWRLGLTLALIVLMASLGPGRWLVRRSISWLEWALGLTSVALLTSMAWLGHAAAHGFGGRLLADQAHLLAVSVWPAGLIPFALFLGCARHSPDPAVIRPLLQTTDRFSNVSLAAVAALVLSGVFNSIYSVGSFAALITTIYGRLLCLKLILFIAAMALAAANRYRLVPALLRKSETSDPMAIKPIVRRLQTLVLIETALAIGIIIVVAFLGVTPPPPR